MHWSGQEAESQALSQDENIGYDEFYLFLVSIIVVVDSGSTNTCTRAIDRNGTTR
jgi:hypothetical protein